MPSISTTFRSGEPSLQSLLHSIHEGKVQLPDFQRGWVWDDDHIRSLIASISQSYPIGAVMLLQAGGEGSQFLPRPVEGVKLNGTPNLEQLILDGQQRMTSLYLSLYSGQPVPTRTEKGKDIRRYYYLDMRKCLDPDEDRTEAVVSVPDSRKVTSEFGRQVELDVSEEGHEYELGLFPLTKVFDNSGWRRGYAKHFNYDDRRQILWDQFEAEILSRFTSYRVPTIELLKETPKEAVCQVFEKVNTGGVTLTVFELLTATYAADNFNLRTDWDARREALAEHDVIKGFDATSLLTAVTLLASYKRNRSGGSGSVSCKRKDVLKLTLDEFRANAGAVQDGLIRAARLLVGERIFDARSVPYMTQLVPLSAICAVLGDRFENHTIRQKLSRWFWCGVFGELYGGANESRFAFDLPEVIAWIDGGDEPRTIRDANFAPVRLLSMQSRLSAAYKGLMALLMKAGCRDFANGDPFELTTYFELATDIHHIFPKAYCTSKGYKELLWNSSVNKTPLSAKTNRMIGGNAPSVYLRTIDKAQPMDSATLDGFVTTHKINPVLLRQDDFHGFIRDRASQLLDLIEGVMGKPVQGRDSEETTSAFGGPLGTGR